MKGSSQEWRYLNGKGFTKGEFIAERLDRLNGISSDVNLFLFL